METLGTSKSDSKIQLEEEDLKILDPLVKDLTHEVITPLNVIGGHLEMENSDEISSPRLEDSDEEQLELLEEFHDSVEYMVSHTDLMGTLPEAYVEDLEEYVLDDRFPEKMRDSGRRITSISRDALNYQNRLLGSDGGDPESIEGMLEPLENCAQNLKDAGKSFDYNGHQEALTGADSGMRILFWTLGKNWEQHAGENNGVYELGFEVEEESDNYVIDVWNTGEGFFEQYPDDSASHKKRRRELAQKHLREDYGGHGLGMAYNIAEVYGGDVEYTEERLEQGQKGFGLEVEVPKYRGQNSTSESS